MSENLTGDSRRQNKTKIKNEKITFSALFFSYRWLKVDRDAPTREQTSLHERKEVSLRSGAHSDPQTERRMSGSLARANGRQEDHDIEKRKRYNTFKDTSRYTGRLIGGRKVRKFVAL